MGRILRLEHGRGGLHLPRPGRAVRGAAWSGAGAVGADHEPQGRRGGRAPGAGQRRVDLGVLCRPGGQRSDRRVCAAAADLQPLRHRVPARQSPGVRSGAGGEIHPRGRDRLEPGAQGQDLGGGGLGRAGRPGQPPVPGAQHRRLHLWRRLGRPRPARTRRKSTRTSWSSSASAPCRWTWR